MYQTKKISNIVDYSEDEVTHFQLFDAKTGMKSPVLSSDYNGLVDMLFDLQVSYRGSFANVYSSVEDPVYHLALALKLTDSYLEEGTIVLGANGCVYIESKKYEVVDRTLYKQLLSLCEEVIEEL